MIPFPFASSRFLLLFFWLFLPTTAPLASGEDPTAVASSPPELLASEELTADKPADTAPGTLVENKKSAPPASASSDVGASEAVPATEPVRYGRGSFSLLDKQTGRLHPLTLQQGLSQNALTLEIEMTSCFMRSNDPQSSVALLQVYEADPKEGRRVIFSAWMFAEHPAISRLEHPVYDLTLLRCEP